MTMSAPAWLQRVMKQLHGSSTYVVLIALLNEGMSCTSVKNELPQCGPLGGEKWDFFFVLHRPLSHLRLPCPDLQTLDFGGCD